MRIFISFVFFIFLLQLSTFGANTYASEPIKVERPSIGLTLSGGGARGFAHIGVLEVLDSLGVKVDYITGTSMGSIVGGMYAVGYTAEEIKDFALSMNWEGLFASNKDLSYIHPAHRGNLQRRVIEIPIENRRLIFSTGAIEGQQVWNTLNEIFLHVHNINDFAKLDIPFACIATNVETGKPVIIKEGNIVSAIRASMAMPSVFTAVERENLKLIDGGVANNFPVVVARDMGADLTIGVNVSQGLRPAEELRTPIDIIYQMGFYSDARSFHENRAATDIYIEPELAGFTAANFSNVELIIERGRVAARKAAPQLLELAQNNGRPASGVRSLRDITLIIDSVQFNGLKNVRPYVAHQAMNIYHGDTISASRLTQSVNRLFATNYFKRVHYNLNTLDENNVILIVDVIEQPFGSISGSLHFSSFTGVGIIGEIATSRLFVYDLTGSASMLIGEKPAMKGTLTYYLDERRRSWASIAGMGRRYNFPLYDDFEQFSEYSLNSFRSSLSINRLSGNNGYFSFFTGHYYQHFSPNMRAPVMISGHTRNLETGINWNYHSLNSNTFPREGQRITIGAKFLYAQYTSFSSITLNNQPATLEDLGIKIKPFVQGHISWETYVPMNLRLTQFSHVQLGYNFDYHQEFIHSFNVGGSHPFLNNQITFIGLNEYNLLTPSILTAALGYQYHLGNGIYTTAMINVGLYDFAIHKLETISTERLIYGGGVSLGYDSLIGPFELTFSYSPQAGKLAGYINLGWGF